MTDDSQFPEAELARLADGSMPEARRAELKAQVERSPELVKALAEQERAIVLIRQADPPAPDSLRAWLDSQTEPAKPVRLLPKLRLAFTLPTIATAAAAALVIALLASGGSTAAPTLAQTTRIALSAAVYPPPNVASDDSRVLTDTADGIPFPNWHYVKWAPTGSRLDKLDGRTIMTVFYGNPRGSRVGYAIVSGPPLPVKGGQTHWRAGVRYTFLRSGSARLVTWRRSGHTCVIAGNGVSNSTLLRLATA